MATSHRRIDRRHLRRRQARRAHAATLGSGVKDAALEAIAAALLGRQEEILEANARDLELGRANGLSPALIDRLELNPARVAEMVAGVRTIAALPDPVGEVIDGNRLPNGLELRRVRVPLGVIAVVYEARPNVTIDAAALCLKSGNAVVLRGSSSAAHSNAVLASVAADAATAAGLPHGAMALLPAAAARTWPSSPLRPARRPDHPARRRGSEGGAEGCRHRAGDLRRVRQQPRVRRLERRS